MQDEQPEEITYTLSEREIDLLTIALELLPDCFDDPVWWDDVKLRDDFRALRSALSGLALAATLNIRLIDG